MVVVEICTENLEDTLEAIRLGADRIELCSDLASDGLSPSLSLLHSCLALGKQNGVDIFPMVRCRGGDFVYSQAEKEVMIEQAVTFVKLGVPGIVIGALDPEHRVDFGFISRISNRVRELKHSIDITFHKAVDVVRVRPGESFADMVAELEPFCTRVLTSGGAKTALEGSSNIRMLAERSGKPRPLAAGKIRVENVVEVVRTCGVEEVHSRSPLIAVALGKPLRTVCS
jgi:copper homeostasis protein